MPASCPGALIPFWGEASGYTHILGEDSLFDCEIGMPVRRE